MNSEERLKGLLHVLVVFGCLFAAATLMAMFFPYFVRRSVEARRTASHVQLENFKTALGAFRNDCGRFPSTSEGLAALTNCPVGILEKDWRGPYLERIAKDSWGQPYVYRCPGTHSTNGFDIYSCGPDGMSETAGEDADDIAIWPRRQDSR
jgi:general secretion pathway protein G